MHAEQRCDEKRIDLANRVEMLDPEAGIGISGRTHNLSAGGLCARFDLAPQPGDVVQLRVHLSEETTPLESLGRVAWSAPDIYGDGADVGLRFVDPEELMPAVEEGAPKPPALRVGQVIEFEVEGRPYAGSVRCVEELADGAAEDDAPRFAVTLHAGPVANAARCEAAAEEAELLAEADDWKPHPIQDAVDAIRRYLGPAISALAVVALPAGRAIARAAMALWVRLPEPARDRYARLWVRLALRGRYDGVRRVIAATQIAVRRHAEAWRTLREARRSH
jgi:hypothetical protein